MAKIASISALTLAGLMASASLAFAQAPASDPAPADQGSKSDGGWFRNFRLQSWDDKPADKPTAKTETPEAKKPGLLSGLHLPAHPEKAAEPAQASNTKAAAGPAKVAAKTEQPAPKKPGLFSGLKLQPWHDQDAAKAQPAPTQVAQTTDKPATKKAGMFSGLRLQAWHETDADADRAPQTTNFTAPGLRLQRWDETDGDGK